MTLNPDHPFIFCSAPLYTSPLSLSPIVFSPFISVCLPVQSPPADSCQALPFGGLNLALLTWQQSKEMTWDREGVRDECREN